MPIRFKPVVRRRARRRFFAQLGGWLGGAFAAPALANDTDASDIAANFESVIDTLIPQDTDPGAVAAGVATTLYTQIVGNAQHRARLAATLAWIDRAARAAHRIRFRELALAERTAILIDLLAAHDSSRAAERAELGYLRVSTLSMFYTSPAGYRMLGYHPPAAGGYPDYADSL